MNDLIDIASAVGTVAAAIVALFAAVDARRSAVTQRRAAVAQGIETKRQVEIAIEAVLIEHHRAITTWADECIDLMAQAHSLTFFNTEEIDERKFLERRAECLWRISALIDRGRLLFPNEAPDQRGAHKPKAFRGFRPVVLDQLKSVYDRLVEMRSTRRSARSLEELREPIISCRRKFVSEVQAAVDPEARQRRIRAIVSAPSTSAAFEAIDRL